MCGNSPLGLLLPSLKAMCGNSPLGLLLPLLATVHTVDEDRHRLICRPRLHFIVRGHLLLAARAAETIRRH